MILYFCECIDLQGKSKIKDRIQQIDKKFTELPFHFKVGFASDGHLIALSIVQYKWKHEPVLAGCNCAALAY